jgi:hypothetical protein
MQGRWMQYGQQPTAFIQSWTTMYNSVKAIAPDTIMVWAPNTPQGYPYGQQQNFYTLSTADQTLLDTNRNGQLDAGDDALSPYYPGDDLVDWIGISICESRSSSSGILPNGVKTNPTSLVSRLQGTLPQRSYRRFNESSSRQRLLCFSYQRYQPRRFR